MKVTVCEFHSDWMATETLWQELIAHVRSEASDLVLLPEMAFFDWLAASRDVDPGRWEAAVGAHDRWLQRLPELHVPAVVGSRPVIEGQHRYNQGFVWQPEKGVVPVHRKVYLPDEEGFREASWYRRGEDGFDCVAVGGVTIGFLICTELWFTAHARRYMHQGIHLLVCPRATPAASVDRWLVGGRAAAIVSGAWCLSSNWSGPNVPGIDFGGTGWVMEPEGGDVLATTSPEAPFATVEIDPQAAENAKRTYPRYVPDYKISPSR